MAQAMIKTEKTGTPPEINPQREVISEWIIEGDSFTLWKALIKNSQLTAFNINVEGIDNIMDADSREGYVAYNTYPSTHNISRLRFTDFGRGMTEYEVKDRFLSFPATTYTYTSSSIGANGYGIKGISMRLGSLHIVLTKTIDDDNWRMYTFTFFDKDGKEYTPSQLEQYRKTVKVPAIDEFLDTKYMLEDIVSMKVTEHMVDIATVKHYAKNTNLYEQESGTFISIHGMEDNGVKLTANDQNTVYDFSKAYYGNVGKLKLNLSFSDSDYGTVKPMRYPVSNEAYPNSIKHLKEFPTIVVDESGNVYDAYWMYNLSDKYDTDEVSDYHNTVSKQERFVNMNGDTGKDIRSDQQVITIFDYNMRSIGSYTLKGNHTFYGSSHNGLNVFLVARQKLKNLDRFKFLGFSNPEEIKSIRTSVIDILKEDMDNKQVYKNPNADKDKREEVSQVQDLFRDITNDKASYLTRWNILVTDNIEETRVKTAAVKNIANYNADGNAHMGTSTDTNQIDAVFYPDGKTPSIILEAENKDKISSKDHLEKVNLWYDEIIQNANEPVEWIVWLAKRHTFENRLTKLLECKPTTNPHFKGFILMPWKDFWRDDSEVLKTRIVKAKPAK